MPGHLLDQYAPGLGARLGALSLEARRRVITHACLVLTHRIPDLDTALRSLIEAAAKHSGLSQEELAMLKSYASRADDRYSELQSNGASTAEFLAWFAKAGLATALATILGSSDSQAAADGAYELCVIDVEAAMVVGIIEAAADRAREV